jgi:hypothetical protein
VRKHFKLDVRFDVHVLAAGKCISSGDLSHVQAVIEASRMTGCRAPFCTDGQRLRVSCQPPSSMSIGPARFSNEGDLLRHFFH